MSFVGYRVLQGLAVVVALTTLVFFVIQLTGDPAIILISPNATAEEIAEFRRKMGLDQPLVVQYVAFLRHAIRGDLGQSFRQHQPALEVVLERVPATLELASFAFLVSIVVGIPLGIIGAWRHNSLWDRLCMVFALFGQSVPVFWLGLMLLLVFGVQLGLLPISGRGSLAHLVLPAVTLGLYSVARITRVTRNSLLETLHQDYTRTARAKGVADRRIILRHCLRNAAIPMLTLAALEMGVFLGGSIITETIFSWPGLGRLMIQSIQYRDFPVVIAGVFVFSVMIVVLNILVDVAYALLDPRITYGTSSS